MSLASKILDPKEEDHASLFLYLLVSYVAAISLYYDAAVGGLVFLPIFLQQFSLPILFFILALDAVVFALFWYLVTRIIDEPGMKSVLILFFTTLSSLILLKAYIDNSGIKNSLLEQTTILLFSLSTYSLYGFAIILFSGNIVSDIRGRVLGISATNGLLLAGLTELIIARDSDTRYEKSKIIEFSIFFFLIATIITLALWFQCENRFLKVLPSKIPVKALTVYDQWILFGITATSLFLIASGLLHTLILSYGASSTSQLRAYAFIVAATVFPLAGWFSDRVGRHVLIVQAGLSSFFALLVAIAGLSNLLVVSLEIIGYYSAIAYFILQISDLTAPKLRGFVGLFLTIIYFFDFIGAIVGYYLLEVMGNIGIFLLTFVLLITSISISIIVSSFVLIEPRASFLMVIRENGTLAYSRGTLFPHLNEEPDLLAGLLYAIQTFASQVSHQEAIKSLQFEEGLLVMLVKREKYILAVFANRQNARIKEKLKVFIKEIEAILLPELSKSTYLLRNEQEIDTLVSKYFPELTESDC